MVANAPSPAATATLATILQPLRVVLAVGAPSPERAEVIRIAAAAGVPVHYACVGNSLVSDDNAYQADRIAPPLPPNAVVLRFACDGPAFSGHQNRPW